MAMAILDICECVALLLCSVLFCSLLFCCAAAGPGCALLCVIRVVLCWHLFKSTRTNKRNQVFPVFHRSVVCVLVVSHSMMAMTTSMTMLLLLHVNSLTTNIQMLRNAWRYDAMIIVLLL